MRHLSTLLAPLLLLGCTFKEDPDTSGAGGSGGSGAGSEATTTTTGATTGSTMATTGSGSTPVDLPKDDNFDEDSTADDALPIAVAAPTQLTPDEGSLVAITADDRLVYSTPGGLFTIKAAVGAPIRKAASLAGNAYARGRTVFNFAKIDYDTGTGSLTFWTPQHGRRFAGIALLGETGLAARADDEQVLFLGNPSADAVDVVISSADAEKAFVLVKGAGRGDMDTCGPTIGFAGDAAVVSWCKPGSTQATLSRFTQDATGAWIAHEITTSAQGMWSSDAAGAKLFYVSTAVDGIVVDVATSEEKKVGAGVAWGRMTKAGDALFFTVGDQLRRSDMSASAVPIVVDGFQSAVAWSPDSSKVLYSSTVLYEDGVKQDLRSSMTAYFNPSPTSLVAEPVATLGRSPMTTDASFALYFTGVGPQGGTLHVQPFAGGASATLPGIDTAVAGAGSVVVVTDNRSAADVFPPLVDLKIYDALAGGAATLLEAGIVDGRDILVRSDKKVVAYRRNGADGGLWIRPL